MGQRKNWVDQTKEPQPRQSVGCPEGTLISYGTGDKKKSTTTYFNLWGTIIRKLLSPFLSRGDFEDDYFLRFLTASNLAYSIVLTADLKPRLVELCRRSVTAGVVGDHIFSDYRLRCCWLTMVAKDADFLNRPLADSLLRSLLWKTYQTTYFGSSAKSSLEDLSDDFTLSLQRSLLWKTYQTTYFEVFCETSVINFVCKDYAEMFPRWDFDVEDPVAENIIKVMFNAKDDWNWTMNCWEVTGTKPIVKKEESAVETESGVKEESAVPWKKARKAASVEASKLPSAEARADARSEASTSVGGMTKEQIEKSFKGIADGFGMCLREIKLLGDRIEAVEKKVGITKKGTASNELQIRKSVCTNPCRCSFRGFYVC
ncbi:unnamed protein product [Brassica oleracea]